MSHCRTIELVHVLGLDFDLVVKLWKEKAEREFAMLQVHS